MGERETTAWAREVGSFLRELREVVGLTALDVAERMGWPTDKVHRVERGATEVSPVELVRFAAHCDAPAGDILTLFKRCEELVPAGYWLSARFASLIFHESTAAFSSSYDPLVVPGLLQTEEYANALIGEGFGRMRTDRQRLMARRGFEFFIHEQALRLPVGGNAVMSEQMLKLALIADQPKITIRVVPIALGERGAFGGEFVMFRYTGSSPLVYLESAGLFVEDHDFVAKYRNRLASISEVALGRGESRELLAALASEFDLPEDSRDVPDHLAKEQL
jgi:transcriptional regulator with XRE-family HTH domain